MGRGKIRKIVDEIMRKLEFDIPLIKIVITHMNIIIYVSIR